MIVHLLFILSFLAIFLYRGTFGKRKRPKRNLPPGPTGLPWVGYLPFLGSVPTLTLTRLAKKYGSIFSLYLGNCLVVFVNDFAAMEEMGKMDVFQGRNQIKLMTEIRGYRGLGLLEGKDWQDWRRFTLKSLRDMGFGKLSMEGLMHEQVLHVRDNLKRSSGQALHLKRSLEIAAINCIWQLLAGSKMDLEDPDMRKVYLILSEGIADQNLVGITVFLPWLAKLLPGFTGYSKALRYLEAPDKLIREVMQSHIDTYSAGTERDFIDVALTKIYETADPDSMFYKDVGLNNLHFTLVDMLFAGADTLSSSLAWAFLYLATNPGVQGKVHAEIDSVLGSESLPSINDRSRLPYVEATLMEVLRKSSIVPMGLMHTALEDTTYQGYFIPKRTVILWNLYHIHHDGDYWKDPDVFRPERFLTPEGLVNRREPRLIPFFVGKRSCPAKNLALDEFFVFFTGILQNFAFDLQPGSKMPDLGQRPGFVLKPPAHPLVVTERLVRAL